MSYDETIALRSALRAGARERFVTFLSSAVVPDPSPDAARVLAAPPFVVVHAGGDGDDQERLTGPQSHRDPLFVLHCVGESPLAAEVVAGWVDQILRPHGRGVTLAVPGRRTRRVRRTDVGPTLDDDGTRPAVWYVPVSYRFRSDPLVVTG